MRRMLVPTEDGGYRLDLNLFEHFDFDSPSLLSPDGRALLGPPRAPDDEMEQRHFDIAAAAQRHVETVLFHLLGWLRTRTGMDAVCLGGGVAMNSVFNGRATVEGPFSHLHVPFAPDDSGNAIGAALASAARLGRPASAVRAPMTSYLGTGYDDEDIARTLARYRLPVRALDDPAVAAARRIAGGKVVGWFQGRMEFGQRALGNRSILADPRDAGMRDKINRSVKYRETFRPFAPAVTAEAAGSFFDLPVGADAPFMERVFQFRPETRDRVPAVVHADGSGRLQIVSREANPAFHRLIEAFGASTGVPMVLNTSFNTSGEPIVESPDDAIRTFYTSGLDALVIGRYLLEKQT